MKKKYLISIVIFVLALSVSIFSYFELNQTKKDLLAMTEAEANNLSQSLKYSIENNIQASEIIRDEILNSLVASLSLIDHNNSHIRMTPSYLSNFCKLYDLDFLAIEDANGVVSNFVDFSNNDVDSVLRSDLKFIKDEDYFWLELGVHKIKGDDYFLIAGTFENDESIVFGGINESKLLNLRKSVGIGKLLNNFSSNPEIEYVVLQDSLGIIAASGNHIDISKNKRDIDAKLDFEGKHSINRIIDYKNKKVYESISIVDGSESKMILKLGLSLEKVRAINQRNTSRTIFLAIGLFLIISVVTALVYQRSRHNELKETHRQMLEYTNLLLSSINEAVIGINRNKEIILYNHTARILFGEQIHNSSYSDLFNDDFCMLLQTLDTFESVKYLEKDYYNKINQKLVLAISTSILFDKSGSPDIVIAVIRDITQIKIAEEISHRNEKLSATSELASGIAHEIRNPMNSINVIAQRLEIEFRPEEDVDEFYKLIGIVRSEIKRINLIISHFLEYSKFKSSELRIEDLSISINKAVNLIKPTLDIDNIKILNNIPSNIKANINTDRMEQVFINLLQNAADSIDGSGSIELNLMIDEEYYIISIRDSGTGIPENIRHKIFDIYFTTKSKGTGLGLGIVNKIVQEHGGSIYFDSSESGTIFYLKFKRA